MVSCVCYVIVVHAIIAGYPPISYCALKEARTKYRHEWISASHDLNRNPDRSPDPEAEIIELPEGTLTIFKKQKSTQEEQSPGQSPRPHNLWRKPKRKKSTPTGNPKQLVVADDNDSADDKKPKKKRTKPENKLIIGQDPQPISSEDSVKKFETRMTPNHLFQLITEINKPTDLAKEPDATGARQVPLNGNNVLDIKQEDVVVVLDLPRGPKPVEEFKQKDPAITDHAEMVDAFKKRMGYSNKFLATRSTAAQLIAGQKDFGEYERAHPRSFSVIKCRDQKMLGDRLRLQGSNFTDVQTLERLKKPSSAASRDEHPEGESQKEDTQANPNTQQVYVGLEQLSQTNDEDSLPVGKSVPTSKEVVVDEQQTQPQAHGTNISTTEKKRSHQDSTGRDSGVTSTLPEGREALEESYETTQEKNTEEDITGSVDLDKDVNETIEAEEYPVPSALDETKNPTPSIDEIIRMASSPASKSLSDTKKLEMIAAAAEEVEKNSKVVEAVPLSIIPPDWNISSTTGGLVMLEKNECTTPPPAISKEADELDEELTKTVEKILNEKSKRRNPPRVHRLPERFRSPFMLQKKNKKKFIQWTEEKKKMTQEEALLIDFALLQRQEEIVKSGVELVMPSMWWLVHDSFAGYLSVLYYLFTRSELVNHSFLMSSRDTISRYYQQGSNKEKIEFTFYERLGLELEEQGLTVASLLAAKAYVLLVEEKKVLVLNNIHAKDLDYYKPTKDLLFRFFKSYVACVFPRIELVSAQYTFTEVTLPSHKDKTPNAEDCGIYTMHHMERYDSGEYEDGTTLDFNTGNIKEYRWKYMTKILMHPANKNKDKIFETMHQFYTNTAEEEQKEIPDHVDLSSKSYYNDRKIQGWVK
ncbi:OLC1v1012472C1 [Oldenlandia corymbosa var. corymbosa]|uniref:OLC1v1012472C1 n=1 Tax=Oldenlandia corymbosa var. corymbosa TaxID=529605 RepID=A0AAV1DW32_OLDCO|nr:OLC1v1012472C1 [Oldenlandia corymbosa var. corymbosa]